MSASPTPARKRPRPRAHVRQTEQRQTTTKSLATHSIHHRRSNTTPTHKYDFKPPTSCKDFEATALADCTHDYGADLTMEYLSPEIQKMQTDARERMRQRLHQYQEQQQRQTAEVHRRQERVEKLPRSDRESLAVLEKATRKAEAAKARRLDRESLKVLENVTTGIDNTTISTFTFEPTLGQCSRRHTPSPASDVSYSARENAYRDPSEDSSSATTDWQENSTSSPDSDYDAAVASRGRPTTRPITTPLSKPRYRTPTPHPVLPADGLPASSPQIPPPAVPLHTILRFTSQGSPYKNSTTGTTIQDPKAAATQTWLETQIAQAMRFVPSSSAEYEPSCKDMQGHEAVVQSQRDLASGPGDGNDEWLILDSNMVEAQMARERAAAQKANKPDHASAALLAGSISSITSGERDIIEPKARKA